MGAAVLNPSCNPRAEIPGGSGAPGFKRNARPAGSTGSAASGAMA